jgi:cephalosporin hydroxylase
MKYTDIHGWFDFETIYDDMVSVHKDGSVFVEVGSWYGKSAAYMASKIKESNKKIQFNCVDIWEATDNDTDLHKYITEPLHETFINNMKNVGVSDYVNAIKADSQKASSLFKNNSLDFVFIDANHIYDFVKNDILSWLPKVKKGGYIGGHDYTTYDGVKKAVDEIFGEKKQVINISWLLKK